MTAPIFFTLSYKKIKLQKLAKIDIILENINKKIEVKLYE